MANSLSWGIIQVCISTKSPQKFSFQALPSTEDPVYFKNCILPIKGQLTGYFQKWDQKVEQEQYSAK